MSVLRANLRLFWDCSSLWVLFAYILCVVIVILMWDLMGIHWENYLFMILAAFVVPISQIVAMMQVEILSCPFALTLPGHQSTVRRVVFIAGLVVSLSATLAALPDIARADHPIPRLGATFTASLIVYFAGTCLTYVFALPGLAIGAVAWLAAIGGHSWGVSGAVTHVVVDFPLLSIIAGSLSAALAWLCLGRPPRWLRGGGSRRRWLSRRWNRHPAGEARYAGPAQNGFPLDLVRIGDSPRGIRYLWVVLCASWLSGGGGRRQLVTAVTLALVGAALTWYLPEQGYVLFLLGPFAGVAKRSFYSELLLTRGRRERFLGALTALMVVGCVWMISIVLSFVALNLVQPYLPQVRAEAADLEQGVWFANVRIAVLLTAAYPIHALVQLAFHERRPQGYAYCVYMIVLPLVCTTVMLVRQWLIHIPLVCVALVLVASWVACAHGLYRLTMQRDLVSGRRDKADWSWLRARRRIAVFREQG